MWKEMLVRFKFSLVMSKTFFVYTVALISGAIVITFAFLGSNLSQISTQGLKIIEEKGPPLR